MKHDSGMSRQYSHDTANGLVHGQGPDSPRHGPADLEREHQRSSSAFPIAVLRLGRIVATPNALQSLREEDILTGIRRHQAGDWGELSEDDMRANDQALIVGTRIVSSYSGTGGIKFWIITEADRSVTTVLLPEDY